MEAHAALKHSDYLDVRSGERLRRAEAALLKQLREYVDRRIQAVFGEEPLAADAVVKTPPAPAQREIAVNTAQRALERSVSGRKRPDAKGQTANRTQAGSR